MDISRFGLLVFLVLVSLCSAFNENFKAELICTKTEMIVYVTSLQGPFTGSVYTEGSFEDDECHMHVDNSQKFMFGIPYDGCLTKQDESHDSIYTNVLIVQRHARILTHDDAAFLIRCDENNMKQGEIVVTETVQMMANGGDRNDKTLDHRLYKSKNLKKQFNEKEIHTIYNDKDTITYVKNRKNTTFVLPSMKQ